MCGLVFNQFDVNKDGVIDQAEVELAVMSFYNQVNKRLPGWQEPPKRARIKSALAMFDANRDGVLSKREFCEFIKGLANFGPAMIGKATADNALRQVGALPATAFALNELQKRAPQILTAIGMGPVANLPPVFLAPLVGVVGKLVKGLVP